MFLSKIVISHAWSRDVYQLHRALWQLFPDRSEAERDFLFRVEQRNPGRGCDILLQSELEPVPTRAADIIASKQVQYRIQPGGQLRFRIRANPVKTIRDERERLDSCGRIKRCRVPLVKELEQRQWLEHKLSSAVCLEAVQVISEPPLYFSKQGKGGKIQPVCFEGWFTVIDSEALTSLLRQGIGPAKAMGCGLLSLAAA